MLNSIEQGQAFAPLLRKGGAVAWGEFFVIFDVAFLHLAANAIASGLPAIRQSESIYL